VVLKQPKGGTGKRNWLELCRPKGLRSGREKMDSLVKLLRTKNFNLLSGVGDKIALAEASHSYEVPALQASVSSLGTLVEREMRPGSQPRGDLRM
jgi:hypothetical protein